MWLLHTPAWDSSCSYLCKTCTRWRQSNSSTDGRGAPEGQPLVGKLLSADAAERDSLSFRNVAAGKLPMPHTQVASIANGLGVILQTERDRGRRKSHYLKYSISLSNIKMNNFSEFFVSQEWWQMPLITALRWHRQEDLCEFKTRLAHPVSCRPTRAT